MKNRSDYCIVQLGKEDFRVKQRFLWIFWVKPDDDGIIANDFKSHYFNSIESAEQGISSSLERGEYFPRIVR